MSADGVAINVPEGFVAQRIATVRDARELAIAPNGDLFVGTSGNTIVVVPDAQDTPGAPQPFATFDDHPMAGVALSADALYAGGQFGVYRVTYRRGCQNADGSRACRPTAVAIGTDGSLFVSEDSEGAVYRIRPER